MDKKNISRNMKLGRYPYTYARVSVMKAKLLKRHDYDKIMKMGPFELVKFLSDYDYREEINALSSKFKGLALIEQALSRNLGRTLQKMRDISSADLGILLDHYFLRYDVENIKIILRAKFTKVDEQVVSQLIVPVGRLSDQDIKVLMKQQTIDDIPRNIRIFPYDAFKNAIAKYKSQNTIVDIEDTLDALYYEKILSFARYLPSDSIITDFIIEEINVSNVITSIRYIKNGVPFASFKDKLFLFKGNPFNVKLQEMAHSKSISDLLALLQQSPYKDVVKKGIQEYKDKNSFVELETALFQHLLRKTRLFMHKHPLSVEVLIGFVFAKEIEVKNLSMIAKANQLGLGKDFIEARLVVL